MYIFDIQMKMFLIINGTPNTTIIHALKWTINIFIKR